VYLSNCHQIYPAMCWAPPATLAILPCHRMSCPVAWQDKTLSDRNSHGKMVMLKNRNDPQMLEVVSISFGHLGLWHHMQTYNQTYNQIYTSTYITEYTLYYWYILHANIGALLCFASKGLTGWQIFTRPKRENQRPSSRIKQNRWNHQPAIPSMILYDLRWRFP
jgi:hypothetical protein